MSALLTRKVIFMGDTAPEIAKDPLTIEGFDQVFDADDSPGLDISATEDNPGQSSAAPEDSPGRDWTVPEAARALHISEKTVLRRLQRGSITGYKVPGQFGPEWRINRTALDRTAQDTASAQPRSGQIAIEAVVTPPQDSSKELREELAVLRKQLEGAIYRNGYLEAKLEEREITIKLLTDSQHKGAWWRRFWGWFVGRS
jgi:excisionase family DNA binding protein